MYRANRIEGRDGFVTFRRKPANWQAKEEEAREAAAPAPSNAGLAAWAFLGSLAVAVAGTVIGEALQRSSSLPAAVAHENKQGLRLMAS